MTLRTCVLVTALVFGACGPGEDPSVRGPAEDAAEVAPELVALAVQPTRPSVAVGEQLPLTVIGSFDGGGLSDVGGEVVWSSEEPRVLTVDALGVAFGVAPGEARVTVSEGDLHASTLVTVREADADWVSLRVRPNNLLLVPEMRVDAEAVATFEDGSTGNVTGSCDWSTADSGVATVDARARVLGVAEGQTQLRARCGGLEATGEVEVAPDGTDVGQCDLQIGPLVLTEGGPGWIVWVAEVLNAGDGYCPGFYIDAYLTDGDPPAADAGITADWVQGLGPGEDALVLLEADGLPVGEQISWLWVNPDGWVEESDTGNNLSGPWPVAVGGRPELVITDFDAVADADSTLFSVTLVNQGAAPARRFWLDLWLDPDESPPACAQGDLSVQVSALDPGATFAWTPLIPSVPGEGGWLSLVRVDGCDATGSVRGDAMESLFVVTPEE